jgi:hypothetical protein
MINCGEVECRVCSYLRIFEYPWYIQEPDGSSRIFGLKYCEHFSRWAQTPETKILLPEPLVIDRKGNCTRHPRCLRSEVSFAKEETE